VHRAIAPFQDSQSLSAGPPAAVRSLRGHRPFLRGVATLAAWLCLVATRASADETLGYTLTPDYERHRLRVELTWETQGRTTSALAVSPRFGQIDDVPALLGGVNFDGVSGVRRQENVWVLTHRPAATIRATYDVNPRLKNFDDWQSIHAPITADDFFHGVGNAFLLVPNSAPGTPAEFETALRWALPAGQKAACSWGVGRAVGRRMTPADLRQAVYFAGNLTTKSVDAGVGTVTVALRDRFAFSADELAAVAAKILRAHCGFFGQDAMPEFVITAMPAGPPLKEGESRVAGSGLFNSFALYMAPDSQITEGVEQLFSHELFHHWNGRAVAAAQPERLVYWFTEGFTDYYGARLLLDAGIWKPEAFARWLNKHLAEYAANPARQASNAEIERDYWTRRDSVGQVAYQRGALLAIRWHARAQKTGTRDGVDRWMRLLVQRAAAGGDAISNATLRSSGEQVLGAWFGAEFERFVEHCEPVEVPHDALPGFSASVRPLTAFELGFEREASLKSKRVVGLVPGSAAARAGLQESDELLSWTLPADGDSPARITVRRGKSQKSIEYAPRGATMQVLQFQVGKKRD
jgi:M61 glycyl aminopeptidase